MVIDLNDRRFITFHDILIGILILGLCVGLMVVLVNYLNLDRGYLPFGVIAGILMMLVFIDRSRILKAYHNEHKMLMLDLELKDALYQLLQKTSSYGPDDDIYEEILSSAIIAIKNGHSGSIIDIRDEKRVKYVAVKGFERSILEKMGLGLKDTYLYKETSGALNKTVIIKNSVNYNQMHANDEIVKDLIEAGTASIRSTLCTPIKVQNKTIGMINIDSALKDAFTERDVQIIEIFALEVGKMIQYYEIIQENIHLSRYDAMTKIYNRGYFYEQHRAMFLKGPSTPYVFVSMDIDNLKVVNDSYGHMVGDQLLVKFVDTVNKYLPEDAIFGRYGGDEFNIILPKHKMPDVEIMMAQVRQDLKKNPLSADGHEIYVLYSYGAVAYPEETLDYKELVILADNRMYELKNRKKGKGQSELD